MKRFPPSIILAALCALVTASPAVMPPFRMDPPQFPDANTIRLTLLTAPTNKLER